VNWHIPAEADVNVWPCVSLTRHELGSQVKSCRAGVRDSDIFSNLIVTVVPSVL